VPTKTPTVMPTAAPTETPTLMPTTVPTETPTLMPTTVLTESPTVMPTAALTEAPTVIPTAAPTETPSLMPTTVPSETPTLIPTTVPTEIPTVAPTALPTEPPTIRPTAVPTKTPTVMPTAAPTETPTLMPTTVPTETPTLMPTTVLTESPTVMPTAALTEAPTVIPTAAQTETPSLMPTTVPTESPTVMPTAVLTETPSVNPTTLPTVNPTMVPSISQTATPTSRPSKYPTEVPSSTPSEIAKTIPSHSPTSIPSTLPSYSPTMTPSSKPTVKPTASPSGDCVQLKEWTQSRADETCPGEPRHAYGVQVCAQFLNENWSSRLEIALANELYTDCDHSCLYDYESYTDSTPHGFKWVSSNNCWNVVDGWYCINDQTAAMAFVHAKAALLCELPEEVCEERREWSEETAEYWCPDGYSGADKGYKTAVVCNDWERLYDGFYESTFILYQESFEKSLANHMYRSCTSVCVYDIDHGTEIGYIWKEWRGCWTKVTAWTCYNDYEKELMEVRDWLDSDLCYEATPSPVTNPCTERELDWDQAIAEAACPVSKMGYTNKTAAAVVCEGYEDYQYRLDHSLANRMFVSCSSWCVYDLYKRAYEAFQWKNDYNCWRPVTKYFCIQGIYWEREFMTDWVDTQLCPSETLEPTYQPTCTPQEEFTEDLMDEYCTVESTGSTFKHYDGFINELGEAEDRAPIACSELDGDESGPQDTLDLKKSLANRLFADCSSWCVYDWYSGGMQAWKWSNSQTCWVRMTWGSCFYDYNAKTELSLWHEMQEKVDNTCTYAPTLSPTSCLPRYVWTEERANEVCSPGSYGTTDRSFLGAVVCSESGSSDKQDQLELTLANEFYISCDSHCLYDYETVLSDVENGVGGFIWKTNCWRWVTGWFCFTDNVADLYAVREFAKGTCEYKED